jgi:arsenate reductase
MFFICYPKCGTCKKAEKWLDERGIKHETRDIKKDGPNETEIAEWRQKSGWPLKKFFNTSGNSYKALGLKDKLANMSEDEQIKLLATDGMLVKRPILAGDDLVLVGFDEGEWEKHFSSGQRKKG